MDKNNILFKQLIAGAKEVSEKSNQKGKKGTQIIIVIVIVIVIIGAVAALIGAWWPGYVKKKRAAFPDDRCTDTTTMKFPNLFGPPGMTYAKNKQFCESAAMNETHKKNILPIQNQLDKHNATMMQTVSFIKDTKKMIYHIRNGVEQEARDVQQKIYNTYKRLAYVFKIFARLFYRVFTVFKDLFMTLKYAVWTLMSIWRGPIGGFIRFFHCFGEETLVNVVRGNKRMLVKINEVKKGDVIEGRDVVLGICEFANEEEDNIYMYKGIMVVGSHLVEKDGTMIRVYHHPEALRVKYNRKKIYNFITETGKMKFSGETFCDYLGDNSFETYEKIVQGILPGELFKDRKFYDVDLSRYDNSAINLYPGFTHDSKIKTNNGVKSVCNLKIGDKINGKKINGIINYSITGKTFITNYANKDINGMLVGIQIYYKNNNYSTINQEERWILGKLECIGITVEGGRVDMGEFTVTDFDILDDASRNKVEDVMFGI